MQDLIYLEMENYCLYNVSKLLNNYIQRIIIGIIIMLNNISLVSSVNPRQLPIQSNAVSIATRQLPTAQLTGSLQPVPAAIPITAAAAAIPITAAAVVVIYNNLLYE